ncbi:MAG: ABC transporter substrate-binding protein [Firmicutes bacterium]|nr:ABC transporter substrate-binding protein [Bacillota bacterium]
MKKFNWIYRGLAMMLCLVMVLSCFTGCATWENFVAGLKDEDVLEEEKKETVRIGVFEPLKGTDREGAAAEIRGIELAHELYPEVLGKPVELVYGDNQSDVNKAEAVAAELVNHNVAVVLGSYTSTLSLLGSNVFGAAEVPAIGITCTNPILTKSNPYYARVCFIDAFQGNAAAKYVFEYLQENRAIVLREKDNDYAAAMAQQFTTKLASLVEASYGGQVEISETSVVYTSEYEKGTTDFSAQIEDIKNNTSGIKVVFLPADAKTAMTIMEAMADMDLIFVGTNRWEVDEFLNSGSEAVEGARFTTVYDSTQDLTDMSTVFLNAYRVKYGQDAVPSNEEALGFDAYRLALEAIEQEGDPENGYLIMRKMTSIREFAGATGSITLNADGDPIKPVIIVKVEDGQMVPEYTAEPVWGS